MTAVVEGGGGRWEVPANDAPFKNEGLSTREGGRGTIRLPFFPFHSERWVERKGGGNGGGKRVERGGGKKKKKEGGVTWSREGEGRRGIFMPPMQAKHDEEKSDR